MDSGGCESSTQPRGPGSQQLPSPQTEETPCPCLHDTLPWRTESLSTLPPAAPTLCNSSGKHRWAALCPDTPPSPSHRSNCGEAWHLAWCLLNAQAMAPSPRRACPASQLCLIPRLGPCRPPRQRTRQHTVKVPTTGQTRRNCSGSSPSPEPTDCPSLRTPAWYTAHKDVPEAGT